MTYMIYTFKSMAPVQESLLHAAFCACHYGLLAGALAPIPLAAPPLFMLYLFVRFWGAWNFAPWSLAVFLVDAALLLASGVLSALLALDLASTAALVSAPVAASVLLLVGVVLTLLPVHGGRAVSVLLKIWLVAPLVIVTAIGAYVASPHPALVLVVALEAVLFLCVIFSVFVGGAVDMATCTVCGVNHMVRPLGGGMFVLILVVWTFISRAAQR